MASSSSWEKTAILVVDMQVREFPQQQTHPVPRHTHSLSLSSSLLTRLLPSFLLQNDFILPHGPLYVRGGAAIVPAVQQAVSHARGKGALIVWVIREHHVSGRDVEYFRQHLYKEGHVGPTVKGTKGSALVDGLQPQAEDQIVVKYRFSAFFGTNLHSILCRAGIQTVVVIGVQTPNCIRQTVFDAVAHDYPRVMVLSDATAAASPELHEANLFDMRNVGVTTLTLAEWKNTQ